MFIKIVNDTETVGAGKPAPTDIGILIKNVDDAETLGSGVPATMPEASPQLLDQTPAFGDFTESLPVTVAVLVAASALALSLFNSSPARSILARTLFMS